MPELHETLLGKKLIQHDIPEIAKQLERIADLLDKILSEKEKKISNIEYLKSVRVTDFGLSRLMTLINNDRTFTLCGTKAFFAPELLFNSTQYDYSIDIWSMGMKYVY